MAWTIATPAMPGARYAKYVFAKHTPHVRPPRTVPLRTAPEKMPHFVVFLSLVTLTFDL